jgi:hypothetical protein
MFHIKNDRNPIFVSYGTGSIEWDFVAWFKNPASHLGYGQQ